jgi:hypothetical protein
MRAWQELAWPSVEDAILKSVMMVIIDSMLHCCYTVVTLLLHCCYTVVTLLLHHSSPCVCR